jgi:hypothetical protein
MVIWQLSRKAWMSTSLTDFPWRISADNRVWSREWDGVEIETKEAHSRWRQARRVVREYHRRITARLARKSAMLDAVAFKSNANTDAFRAVSLRDGRQITGKMGDYEVIGTSKKHERIYYGAATPTVPPSRARSRVQPRVNTEGFLWIVRVEDGTYTTTPRNPGLQVSNMVLYFACTDSVGRSCLIKQYLSVQARGIMFDPRLKLQRSLSGQGRRGELHDIWKSAVQPLVTSSIIIVQSSSSLIIVIVGPRVLWLR